MKTLSREAIQRMVGDRVGGGGAGGGGADLSPVHVYLRARGDCCLIHATGGMEADTPSGEGDGVGCDRVRSPRQKVMYARRNAVTRISGSRRFILRTGAWILPCPCLFPFPS